MEIPVYKHKIGIVIFHKNAKKLYKEKWLQKFFNSILNQTYKDFIIYEINYGADDYSILKNYNSNKGIFYNIEMENHAEAMNFIITKAFEDGCDFVFNTNVDDYYEENRIEEQLKYLIEGYDLISSNFWYIKEKDNEDKRFAYYIMSNKSMFQNLMNNLNVIAHPCVAYSKKFWNENKYNPEEIPVEDLNLWKRSIQNGFKFFICQEILLNYRIHENQICNS